MIGLLFVLACHGAVLYGLWSYRIIPTPEEALTLMVNLINPPPPADQPKRPKPELPRPPEPTPVEPPKPEQLVAETPILAPEKTDKYVMPAAPPPPLVSVLQLPSQPVVLSGELSVDCPERSAPDYPRLSMRMNEEGKVILRVELGEDGRVAHVEVISSSGYQRLDNAALSTVKTWRCKPAISNGKAVRAVALQPFNFVMEGR